MTIFHYVQLLVVISVCIFILFTRVFETGNPYFDFIVTFFITHFILRDLVPIEKPKNKTSSSMNEDRSPHP